MDRCIYKWRVARNKKIVVNEKELSNLYQDLSQDILKKLTFDQTVEDNQNQLLFLTCCEKSLTYFADEVSSYFKNDLKDFNTLNFFYKWRELSEISTISNIIVNEIGQNGFINQINLSKSNILQKDNDNLIVSTQSNDLKKFNLLLDKYKIGENNYKRLTVSPNIWFGFKGIGKKINLVVNISDIVHDPKESKKLPINLISKTLKHYYVCNIKK